MKKIKVVYIHPSQLSERWLQYYKLDELQNIFDIEYWDCSAFANPSFKAQEMLIRPYLYVLRNENELRENLTRIPKDSLIVCDLHKNAENYGIYKIIAKLFRQIIYINFFSNTQGAYKSKILSKLANSSIKDIVCYFLIKRELKIINISSRNSAKSQYRINHPDYEQFQKTINQGNTIINKDFIVYIDNYFPFHPEISKRNSSINPNRLAPLFYKSLNSFFQKIERNYGCKVIIAAHPSSVYAVNPFEGRKLIYNKTCELIKDCKAVCMHTSNAISFAILCDKPIALLSNAAFKEATLEWKKLHTLSNLLSLDIINTDETTISDSLFSPVNSKIANQYKQEYLIANPNANNALLFINHFKSIYKKYCLVAKNVTLL